MGKREKRKGSEVNSLPTPLQGGEGSESYDGDVEFSSKLASNRLQVGAWQVDELTRLLATKGEGVKR